MATREIDDHARLRRAAASRSGGRGRSRSSSPAGGASAAGTPGRTRSTLDVRPGGAFRVTTVNDEDGSEMTNEGDLQRGRRSRERLAFGEAVVTFTDLGDGRTEMTLPHDDRSRRDAPPSARGRAGERVRPPRRAASTAEHHEHDHQASSPASTSSASRPTTSRRARDFYETCSGSRPRACGSGRARRRSAPSSRPARSRSP